MTHTDRLIRSRPQLLAWQGWTLSVPASWNPVKVDGDSDDGSLLLADLHSARLGLRWKLAGRRGDPAAWAERALVDEVGKLAAAEAIDYAMPDADEWSVSRLYHDPSPPGRDVWVGHSRRSNRLLQIVHHAAKRDTLFADVLLPSLTDTSVDAARRWAVFDLSFVTPANVAVQWYRFNAGDLSVGLADTKRNLTLLRQVGPASLALARQPLSEWLTRLPAATRRLYHPIDRPEPTSLDVDGRRLDGLRGVLRRKRRLFWLRTIAAEQTVLAFHDPRRDRIVIGQSADEPMLRERLSHVGWHAIPDGEETP
ncbi:MAG TPA: hypothetical protein VF595_04110 [Tepidisphaeraceae bacterium]|jgi:hypothetical protein